MKHVRPAFSILIFMYILHLSGCGGGGGTGGSGNSAGGSGQGPSAVPPAILSTTPGNGATFSNDNPVVVTFSKEMDASTINSSTFKIDGVKGTITYSGKTASFMPTDDLAPHGRYTATLTKEVKDTAGNRLASDYIWSFTIGDASDPPAIIPSHSSLAFIASTGGPLPPPQTVALSIAEGTTLSWSVKEDSSWLAETPSSGTASSSVEISVKITRLLPPGTYTGMITITPSEAQDSPTNIPVSYTVTSSPSAACIGPIRTPYIAFDTPTTATLAWECAPQGAVEWGADSTFTHRTEDHLPDGNKHFVTLSPLTPGTHYSYRVMVDGGILGQGDFQTAGGPGDNHFSFVAFGDSGTGSPAQLELASLMETLDFSFAIIAGDVIYESGLEGEFDPHYFIPYQRLINHLPFFPVAGNHDLKTDQGATFMSDFYHPTGKLYYDFHWGDTHFIALDSTNASDPNQMAWLTQTLSSSTSLWKIVYFHHPAYSSGSYGGYRYIQERFVPLFEKYHVDVVFNGHDHDYERTQPINGIVYIVTGGGGAYLRPVGHSAYTAFSQSIHHIVRAEMTSHTLTLNAIDPNGTIFDSSRITK